MVYVRQLIKAILKYKTDLKLINWMRIILII